MAARHMLDVINPIMLDRISTLSFFKMPYKSQHAIDKEAIKKPSKETSLAL
jgi:hypothetical protein